MADSVVTELDRCKHRTVRSLLSAVDDTMLCAMVAKDEA
jgi:hypothetical protein